MSRFICGGVATCCAYGGATASVSTLGSGSFLFSTLGGGIGTGGEIVDTGGSE